MPWLWKSKKPKSNEKENLNKDQEKAAPIITQVVMKCELCDGKGKRKFKRKADGWESRYGGSDNIEWTEECSYCNSSGKIIKTIPNRD